MTRDKPEELPTTLETEMAENSLKEEARLINDHKLLAKISGQYLTAKELKLHNSCRKSYMSKAKRLKDQAQPSVPTDHEKAISLNNILFGFPNTQIAYINGFQHYKNIVLGWQNRAWKTRKLVM